MKGNSAEGVNGTIPPPSAIRSPIISLVAFFQQKKCSFRFPWVVSFYSGWPGNK